ncbi:MAG TPA: sigma-70 family RNA polymerase sigma factor, partial [Bacteroidetes bacterium]|nr:sigma-70 family RNA polymerase sigma factor [Bacteroidota bacterium]
MIVMKPNSKMLHRSDKDLMLMVIERNHQAFKVLYQRYEISIYNFILRYIGNRELSQDLLQETFTRIWCAAHSFNAAKGNFKGWLFTIALNIIRSEMSKKRYGYTYLDINEISGSERKLVQPTHEQPDKKVEHLELEDKIQQALLKLQPFLREVIILNHFQQLKFREIAQITNTPVGTLKSRFHRAVGLLK